MFRKYNGSCLLLCNERILDKTQRHAHIDKQNMAHGLRMGRAGSFEQFWQSCAHSCIAACADELLPRTLHEALLRKQQLRRKHRQHGQDVHGACDSLLA